MQCDFDRRLRASNLLPDAEIPRETAALGTEAYFFSQNHKFNGGA